MKIVLRDENEELMNLFLLTKAKRFQNLSLLVETGGGLAHWGPRPKGATDLITNYKKEHGAIDETAKTDLQLWYLHDKACLLKKKLFG
jgi:hypothetical protein